MHPYLPGWKAYYGRSQTPGIGRSLEEGLRHRLRAIQLKHGKRGTTIYRELRKLGATEQVARRVAANSRRGWRNGNGEIKRVLTIAYFDNLGVPRLS
jgi:RNA-directed DNA polymerase